jgi:hypothetical protein
MMGWMQKEERDHLLTLVAVAAEMIVVVPVSGIAEADIENDHRS